MFEVAGAGRMNCEQARHPGESRAEGYLRFRCALGVLLGSIPDDSNRASPPS